MIQIPAQAKVVLMHEPVNFRKGIEGMAAVARVVLELEPMDGTVFAFLNKGRHMLRLLFYDGGGFWLCTKRLSKGRFTSWPKGDGEVLCSGLLARELQILLWGGDPQSCAFPKLWRKIA